MTKIFDLIIELCYYIAILQTRETPKEYIHIPLRKLGVIWGVLQLSALLYKILLLKKSANSKNILQHKSICSKSIKSAEYV